MKKALLAALGLLVSVGVAGVTPVLVEAYQEGQINIPPGESDSVIVAEITFSVDTACYALLVASGMAQYAKAWLEADGNALYPVMDVPDNKAWPIPLTFIYPLESGNHNISFYLTPHRVLDITTTCRDAYLQALIFLPDTSTGAIAEQPTSDAEPLPNTPSLISKGPFVHVAGASELVDASGRVIENAITEDKVYISNLSTGTYFARDGERTIVKIVKVE